jgi:hypothetical protein
MQVGTRLKLAWPKLGLATDVEVLELVPEQYLLLRHGSTELRFSVAPDCVAVTHSGIPSGDIAEGVGSSWRVSLGVLSHYIERHDGRDRSVHWATGVVRTSAATAHVYFTDSLALGQWLTNSGSVGDEGGRCELELAWGPRVTGTVVANTPGRDVAIAWEEQASSILTLRTLPSPRSEDERLVVVSWSCWGGKPDPAQAAQLDAALARLQRVLGAPGSA